MRNYIYRFFQIIRSYAVAFIERYSFTAFLLFGAGTLFFLLLLVFVLTGFWNVLKKARYPGYFILIPFYNFYVLTQLSGNSSLYFWLSFVPLVNIFTTLKISLGIAEAFDKSKAFGIGLWLLPPIFALLLGFGEAQCKRQYGLDEDDVHWVRERF